MITKDEFLSLKKGDKIYGFKNFNNKFKYKLKVSDKITEWIVDNSSIEETINGRIQTKIFLEYDINNKIINKVTIKENNIPHLRFMTYEKAYSNKMELYAKKATEYLNELLNQEETYLKKAEETRKLYKNFKLTDSLENYLKEHPEILL